MEDDRFDDVEVRFIHDPDSPQLPPRRRRGWVAGVVAAALLAGGFAAVASAGGDSGQDAAPAAKKVQPTTYPEAGRPHMRDGKPCDRDGTRRARDVSNLY